jgi:hypothetical protein
MERGRASNRPRVGEPALPARHFPGLDRMLCLLHRADSIRKQVRDLTRELDEQWRRPEDDDGELDRVEAEAFQQGWSAFLAAGGSTADDLKAWLAGAERGPEIVRVKHLRLVSARRPARADSPPTRRRK